MNKNIKITVASCLAAVVVVILLTVWQVTGDSSSVSMSPEQLREVGAMVYEQPLEIADFSLEEHTGRTFNKSSLTGQWSLLFFGFTSCPDICPITMNELARFYASEQADEYRADTQVIMVSVDPFRDTAETVGNYVTGFHPDFKGVVGEYEDVAALARQLFIAHSQPPAAGNDYLIDHSGNIIIINPRGQYHGFLESSINSDNIARAYDVIRSAWR